jgi:hypothetical protein
MMAGGPGSSLCVVVCLELVGERRPDFFVWAALALPRGARVAARLRLRLILR